MAVAFGCAVLFGAAGAPSSSFAATFSTVSVPPCNNTGDFDATVTSTDPDVSPAGLLFRLDGAPQLYESDVDPDNGTTTISLTDGRHTLEYWGEGVDSNNVPVDEFPHHIVGALVDTAGPDISIDSNQGKTTYAQNEPATIRVVATDFVSGLQSNPSTRSQPIPTNVPGTFTISRSVNDNCGNSNMDSFTYTVIANARISNLTVRPSSFVAAPRGRAIAGAAGAAIRYQDTEAATTTFTVERPAPGVIQKGQCVKPTRARPSGKRCTRYLSIGSFRHRDRVGVNRFRFTGRVGGRKLGPGPYRLKAVALGTSGAPSREIFAPFRILP
jgi:hypothetical protein